MKNKLNEFENEIFKYLEEGPIHDRFLSCDAFEALCKYICKKNNLSISILDCMALWNKFNEKEYNSESKWLDEDGDCACDVCQKYKMNKKEKDIQWLLKYPDTLPMDEYQKRCTALGLIPVER